MPLEFLKCMRPILRQGDKNLEDYYNHFKGMIDEFNQYHLVNELNQYHPVTNDIEVLKK